MGDIEELRSQNAELCREVESLKSDNNSIKIITDELLKSNKELYDNLSKSSNCCKSSVKNYFDFIEIFKSLQNAALKETKGKTYFILFLKLVKLNLNLNFCEFSGYHTTEIR
jgi:hypothetical protein